MVVTPYFGESREVIQRNIDSVERQPISTSHLLVADGRPQDWIDDTSVRHLRLDAPHGDYGNTARGLGGLLAASEGYEPIMFLDADNWLEPDHVGAVLSAADQRSDIDVVVARRHFRRLDESILDVADEPDLAHVDTNCLAQFRGSYDALAVWVTMPREVSAIGDRVYWAAVQGRSPVLSLLDRPTVNYACLWESLYQSAGEEPPAEAKPNINGDQIVQWWRGLSDREQALTSRLMGGVGME